MREKLSKMTERQLTSAIAFVAVAEILTVIIGAKGKSRLAEIGKGIALTIEGILYIILNKELEKR